MAQTKAQQIAKIDAQIVDLTAKRTALAAQLATEVNEDHIVEGAEIQFSYGKGTTKRTVTGTVVAVKPADPAVPKSAAQIKAAFGTGFEAQFAVIYFSQVEKVVSSPVAEPTAEAVAA